MIDKLLIPHFSHIDADPDVAVRKMVVEIVIGMAQGCSRDEFFDLINIIEKVWVVQLSYNNHNNNRIYLALSVTQSASQLNYTQKLY